MKRRKLLRYSTIATAGLFTANFKGMASSSKQSKWTLNTALCNELNIKYPLLQAGMGGVAGPELVAKVSEAGGLGILTGTLLSPDELRSRIKKVKQLTSKPFAVNLIWHNKMLSPPIAKDFSAEEISKYQAQLNTFRKKLKIPEVTNTPPEIPDLLHAELDVILEENVPVLSIGLGNLQANLVDRCHKKGTKVISMITTVEDAQTVAAAGVDVIIAQGSEAGGHRSTWDKKLSAEVAAIGCMALVPQVVDVVKQPVVAAGGITDGRGLAAALALGATGVLIGTRFIATKESAAPPFYKEAVIKTSSDHTTITDAFSGAYARVIKNNFTEEYRKTASVPFPPFIQFIATQDIYKAATEKNESAYYPLWAGQGIGSFKTMPGADEVVISIIEEAQMVINKMQQNLQ